MTCYSKSLMIKQIMLLQVNDILTKKESVKEIDYGRDPILTYLDIVA